MFACLYVPDFPVQAVLLSESEDAREALKQSAIAVLDGPENLLRVVALNDPARNLRIQAGMTKLQAETCPTVLLRKRSEAEESAAQAGLIQCANTFSPRVESITMGTALLDLHGTERLFGTLASAARKIDTTARKRGFSLHIGIASNPDTALYAARGFTGITMIPEGEEAQRLAGLSIDLLPVSAEMSDILHNWGIRTFQSLAGLPEIALTERLGQGGLYLQKLARGVTRRTLVPTASAREFRESYEFDDPIETLESLSFVLNHLLHQVCSRLASQALSTNQVRLMLDLAVTQRQAKQGNEQYQQEWKLPVPTQDGRMLFTLLYLDLERNTFSAPIRKVTIEALPIQPRTAQGNLFAPPSPDAEKLEITLARIRGIVGGTDADGLSCVGFPVLLDTHKAVSFAVQPFSNLKDSSNQGGSNSIPVVLPTVALRAFRPPVEAAVELHGSTPQRVCLWKKHRRVVAASGPWCSSGNWWNGATAWVREEWDIALSTSAGIGVYRIYLDRIRKRWFVEGIFD
jgi:protein ImuB